ncbi:FAD-binding domain-containing protein [Burkholderia multivorans]|uniref:FAD-binding domain-containing protein n=1 Tax=Burkholderia multivorans TaxID=87883 RepID=UPI0020B3C7F2|nr:FAD-binding domain-containing protein [Burkholderia multivorans]
MPAGTAGATQASLDNQQDSFALPIRTASSTELDKAEYTRHWVPELSKMSAEKIHAPWTASAEQLHDACVSLGRTYPFPIVDHQAARTRALESVKRVDSQKNA